MADVSYGGWAPRRTQAIIGRPLSFQICASQNAWRTTASPVDIPGASPPRPSTPKPSTRLLSTSMPQNKNVAVSQSLPEQCRLDDRGSEVSPRSSFKECGRRPSRAVSEAAISNKAPWATAATWRTPNPSLGVTSSTGKSDRASRVISNSPRTEFTKYQSPQARAENQVSALSAALRSSASPADGCNAASDAAEHQRTQDRTEGRKYQCLTAPETRASALDSLSPREEAHTKRLACPFFKRNPHRYQEERSCVGPGWRTVHRVKEHLYRCHTLPVHCLRCHKTFPDEELLLVHSSSDTPCENRDPEEITLEGIGLSQERRLRSRKRSHETEEQKWLEVYKICFPNDANLPNPYYEIPTPCESPTSDQPSELAQYEAFVRSELPRRVRFELERRIEQELTPIEEHLKGQLVDIVRDLQLKLLDEFKRPRQDGPRPLEEPVHEWGLESDQARQIQVVQAPDYTIPVRTPAIVISAIDYQLPNDDLAPAPQGGLDGIGLWAPQDDLLFPFPLDEEWGSTLAIADHNQQQLPPSSTMATSLTNCKGFEAGSGVLLTNEPRQQLAESCYQQSFRF